MEPAAGAAGAVLYSQMSPDPSWEDAFNQWYDQEHVAVRLPLPGFRGARRYRAVGEGPAYAVVYALDGLDALATPAYEQVKRAPSERTAWMLAHVSDFTRYAGEEIGSQGDPSGASAPLIYPVLFAVPPEREDEFNRWYDQEHVPILLGCPDWLLCRRYRIRSGEPGPYTHLALHYLRDEAALHSPAREQARGTAWRARLAAEPWFRGVYHVYRALPAVR